MSNNQVEDHDGDDDSNRPDSERMSVSPGSHSNSSSRSSARQQRIVELLHSDERTRAVQQDTNQEWVIGDEFYDEDVAENPDTISIDDDDDDIDNHIDTDEEMSDGEENHIFGNYHDAIIDEFVEIEPDDESTTESDDDDDDDNIGLNYDTRLPTSHQYLGDNLEESRGRQALVENSVVKLLLLNFRHIVLLPGQTLPITTSNMNLRVSHCLLECVNNGTTIIGLMSDPAVHRIGTTAEIRSFSIQNEELKLIVEGRQRFEIIGESFEIAKIAEVKILPEVSLGHPYPHISSLIKFYSMPNIPPRFIISKHPYWLLKSHDARIVMQRILDQIQDWCNADLSHNPNDFSYWVASNLPISNQERMKALTFSCTEARLLWLLDVLRRSKHFACSTCRRVFCEKADVFLMSRSGPQCSFVNASGFVHDTITVRKAPGLTQVYNWSSEFSWFPGYSWRIAHCGGCNRHIGWCFKSVEAETKPRKFFGLSRVNVKLV